MKDENCRDEGRVDILGELQGEILVFEPMRITQILAHGVQIDTPFPLHLDSLHDFRLTLGADSFVVKGSVVHSSIDDVEQEQVTYCSGVEFVEPLAHVASSITNFVQALQSDRVGGSDDHAM